MSRRLAPWSALLSLVVAIATAACGDYKPVPLNPAPGQSGRKHCAQPSDCASGACGADGYCL